MDLKPAPKRFSQARLAMGRSSFAAAHASAATSGRFTQKRIVDIELDELEGVERVRLLEDESGQ